MNRRALFAAVVLALLNLFINWKILLPGASPYRESIERGYAFFGKLFAANPDYLSWNAVQYCGIPMHYVYLPLLPYLDALLIWLTPDQDATWIHRAVCGIALLLGPSAVCLMSARMSGSAKWAFWSGAAITFLSPLYGLIDNIGSDRGMMAVPWRIQALIKYGEGPHTVGLLMIPIALLLVWRAARGESRGALIAAAAALAATTLSNWVAAVGLAFAVLAMIATYFPETTFSTRRIVVAGGIGCGFACFWLTPGFVSQMFLNWPKDAFGYQYQRAEQLATLGWVASLLLIRLIFWKLPAQRYLCWLTLCTAGFGIPVSLFYRYGLGVLPEARRYALEYEMFMLLVGVEVTRQLLEHRRRTIRVGAMIATYCALLYATPHVLHFVEHRYEKWTFRSATETAEYRVASALNALHPQGRVYLTGGSRLRTNSWYPLHQTGGVFESGLKVRFTQDIAYQILTDLSFSPGHEASDSIDILRAMGVEYLVVHGKDSEEYYRDMKNPGKFDGHLEKVWSERGDSIYKLPPAAMAHLIKEDELPADTVTNLEFRPWEKYAAAMDDPERPRLTFSWIDARHARITGQLRKGYRAAMAVSWDPNWRAYSNGVPAGLRKSGAGTLVTDIFPGDTTQLDLVFEPSLEERTCAGISLLTLLFSIIYLVRRPRSPCAVSSSSSAAHS